ncbi:MULTISPECIES: GNAT family N-acetyltransferase [unclassified Frankia]|uniref:GNAT family N-acetyltransferase n=1 Tax=unclassified Frankia TaxID=2632575 RepID=UPI001EF4B4F9|nr:MULTISPECIES: GNAT family N-acetyltransferase [unclassified Frankia]
MEIKFQDLTHDDEDLVIEFLVELYPTVSEAVLRKRFSTISSAGWHCTVVLVDGMPTALGGYWIQTRFWCGRYMYLDHFVTHKSQRSLGVGRALLDHLLQLARDENCETACFDSFIANERGQKFGHRAGFENVGLHFVLDLTKPTALPLASNTTKSAAPLWAGNRTF